MVWSLQKRAAVVVDNDWSGDPDGLVALAHHALSPADDIIAVTATSTSPIFGDPTGQAARAAEYARQLLDLVGSHHATPVLAGMDTPFTGSARANRAAQAIVDAATLARDRNVILVCGGPLTNVADALTLDPSIAQGLHLAWVGGSRDKEEFEYNRDTDAAAADFVFADPHLTITQFPMEVYRMLAVSVAELEDLLTTSGELGNWLWQKFLDLPLPSDLDVDPVWPLGDNAPVAMTALAHSTTTFEDDPENPRHRRCTGFDQRLILGDLVARLRLHGRGARESGSRD